MSSSLRVFALASFFVFMACPQVPAPPPEPGPLQAGVATRRLDLPVGIAMGGYLRTRPASDPGSPWARQLPASQGLHSDPTVRVVAFTNGLTRLAFVRLDTTLVSPTLRSRLMGTLAATGETANLLLFATHTHAGPARIMPPARLGSATGTDFVSLVMDHYDAEIEQRMTKAITEAVTEAFATLKPVSIGVATLEAGDFNSDRRCENDPLYGRDFRDTALTVIRIDEVDERGAPVKPLTALMHYAMHGTVLGSQNTLQSTEAPGAFELYASDTLGIPVVYVQGAAGDVSPRGGPYEHDELQQLERQGRALALLAQDAFQRALPGQAVTSARLDYRERGVLLSRAAFGYEKGEFPESGALQCAAGSTMGACGSVKSTPDEVVCLPLEPRKPSRTALSLVRVGDVQFFSQPGELGTGLSRKLVAALAPLGASTVLPVGYSQDHLGYLLEEDDWLRGGYEPTVSAYGWKFGPYLLAQMEDFVATIDQPQEPPDLAVVPAVISTRPVSDSMAAASVVTEPLDAERLATHVFEFEGGDPALGTPRVSLEKQEGAAFVPVQASSTRLVINGPELMLRYRSTPTFRAEPEASVRVHTWRISFETIPSTALGTYRLVARGAIKRAGAESNYELVSRAFEVTRSTSVGARVSGRITADGRYAVEARFPPNPTQHAMGLDDVIGAYRVRDQDSSPKQGALARGGTAMGTLRAPDLTMSTVALTWSAAESAWVSAPLTGTGSYQLELAPGALLDGFGNENGGVLSTNATK
ncbi:MAG: neutral/alkaline non-lysosomal ceramidase N-terminal domain-containing protein [Archangium sp.]|nr:neutral/alkaline non-lysosomal ceramidase N-terminal domain-containing protein [Archangium sp.]